MEQRGGRVIPENKERVVRGTGARDANGKRNVRGGHGCVGSRDFWHSPSRTGMERAVLKPIAYGSKVLSDTEMKYGAESRDVRGGYFCRKI